MSGHTYSFSRALAIATVVGGLAFAPVLYAATAQGAAPAESYAESGVKGQKALSPDERIETRIKELHDKLKITDAQSSAWATVADTMRENEKTVHALIEERHAKGEAQTAIEDLTSYQKIAAAHADSLEKFIQVFQPFYDSLSDEQKKNADAVFGSYEGHRRGRK